MEKVGGSYCVESQMKQLRYNMETCPYCEAKVFSVALHTAVCPNCVADPEPEEVEFVVALTEYLEKLAKADKL